MKVTVAVRNNTPTNTAVLLVDFILFSSKGCYVSLPPNGRVQQHAERVDRNPLSGLSTVSHSDYDISLFVSFVHISVSFGHLLQRIAFVNDRF